MAAPHNCPIYHEDLTFCSEKDVIVFAVICLQLALFSTEGIVSNSPSEFVKSFYASHFASNMTFTKANIEKKRKWLSPELYGLLRTQLNKTYPPNEMPLMTGDPFTNSQEHPDTFRIARSQQTPDQADVEVDLLWLENKQVIAKRTYIVKVKKIRGAWTIDNIVYGPTNVYFKDLQTKLKKINGMN